MWSFTKGSSLVFLYHDVEKRSKMAKRSKEGVLSSLNQYFPVWICMFLSQVLVYKNLKKEEMKKAIENFCKLCTHVSAPGMYTFFYFAGHGFEDSNYRFILPRDAKIENNKATQVMRVENIKWTITSSCPARLHVFILDCCRTRYVLHYFLNLEWKNKRKLSVGFLAFAVDPPPPPHTHTHPTHTHTHRIQTKELKDDQILPPCAHTGKTDLLLFVCLFEERKGVRRRRERER